MAAGIKRLFERQERGVIEPELGSSCPEQQDVDPAIGLAGRGIHRQPEPAGLACLPRLLPGQHTVFHIGDDPSGDFLIKIA
jgi:hypothetical protein